MTLGKYCETMLKIEITEDMRRRLIENIGRKVCTKQNKKRYSPVAKILSAAACFIVLLTGIIILSGRISDMSHKPEPGILTSPDITEKESDKELSDYIGFVIKDIPSLLKGSAEAHYKAYNKELAEIIYSFPGRTITYRKSFGSKDNSGIYGMYDEERIINLGGYEVTLKGNDGVYPLVLWNDGHYAFSIHSDNGLSEQEIQEIILEITEN
ncbi:hypothetical protein [Qiania dongpingensis]|uniref:DUF4367 domain-containing protein n=1 Tax=Qiania dongpingensis TaxID=2763669 RepID=A0A7G9G2W9_9FIRM|nr:hypothetical protein [Qiania dongpingensis]QNM05151.1 hypothetical protein H9Q78_11980 [Qiania dongpingensis]